MKHLIRFDWAVKRLLRNKANFGILEGFLSELLGEDISIDSILESESNRDTSYDKFNRVDLLVSNSKGELIIIEIQNNREHDYLLRILYGTSKLLVENMDVGMRYASIKKIISVNIVYFDLGHGQDYIYHGTTNYVGLNKHDILKLSADQEILYKTPHISSIYPEYYVIKVNQFNEVAKNTLDEWVYFLKTDEIKDDFKAKGLKQAKEQLDILKLSDAERKDYERYVEQERYEESLIISNYMVGEEKGKIEGRMEGMEQGKRQQQMEMAARCLKKGMSIEDIAELTGLTADEIRANS